MPDLSDRGRRMPASPIRKLVPFAEAAKRRGVHVYHLNIGQPDIATPPEFLAGVRETEIEVLAYGHSGGLWEYRDELVTYYGRHGVTVTRDEILVTTGGSEAILFTLLATMDPDDELIVPEPFYTNYSGFAVEAGVRIVPLTCRIEDRFALPPVSEIEALHGPRTRAILICNPNNPTGYVYSDAELEALRDLACERDLFLIADEVYREFAFDGRAARSVLALPGIDERAIVVDSVSKRYSACGARIGAIVTKNRDVLDAALRMGQARLCPPTLEQWGAARAVHTPKEYFAEVLTEYQARRDAAISALTAIPGVTAFPPGGAFYTIARLPIDDGDAFCRWLLEEFQHEGETVMMAPAAGFYATEGLGLDEVRIAFVLDVASMGRAMEILRLALAAYPGRRA